MHDSNIAQIRIPKEILDKGKEEVICPKRHSKDTSVIKGYGLRIDGSDLIGITFN